MFSVQSLMLVVLFQFHREMPYVTHLFPDVCPDFLSPVGIEFPGAQVVLPGWDLTLEEESPGE